MPEDVDKVYELTQYAVQTRYPGIWEPVTKEEATSVIWLATLVLEWVEEKVGKVG